MSTGRPPGGGRRVAFMTLAAVAACGRTEVQLLPADADSGAPPSDNVVFRSVGPGNGAPLARGTDNALTVFGYQATFASPLPDRVGVGDVLQYDSNDDGDGDVLAFVYRRESATRLTLEDAAGGMPVPTATADTRWSLFRAYVSLTDALAGNENPGIAAGLRNFDDGAAGIDLVARDLEWRIACYADGVDTTPAVVAGFVTDAGHRLTIFTPSLATEVGVSQRHHGAPSSDAYRIEAVDGLAIANEAHYVTIAGLQVRSVSTGSGSNHGGILNAVGGADASDVGIANNLVWAENGTGTDDSKGIEADPESDAGVTRIWNNIVHGFQCTESDCRGVQASNGAVYALHNTVVDCHVGIDASSLVDTLVLKNNLSVCHAVDAAAVDFGPVSTTAHAGNVSSDSTSPDGLLANRAVRFASAAASDFHLDASDTGAKDQGISLLSDPIQAVVDDIDGETRQLPVDAGADEI